MNKVTIDANLCNKLRDLLSPVALCDEAGRTVGHYIPEDIYMQLMYAWAHQELDKNPEELRQAREEIKTQGGMTTAEAIAHLQKLIDDNKRAS
jgi:hypothetical protein